MEWVLLWLACGAVPALYCSRKDTDGQSLRAILFCALLGPIFLAMYLHGGDDIEEAE